MERVLEAYEKVAWINPVPQLQWDYTQSIELIKGLVEGHMYPLTVKGLEQSMAYLSR